MYQIIITRIFVFTHTNICRFKHMILLFKKQIQLIFLVNYLIIKALKKCDFF